MHDSAWDTVDYQQRQMAKLIAERDAARADVAELVGALAECESAMTADDPADGWSEIIARARALIAKHTDTGQGA